MVKKQTCVIWINYAIVYKKTDYIYKEIAEDVKTKFDTPYYELNRPLPKGKNKKVMKDELGGKIIKQFIELRAKTYSYLTGNNNEDKKAKGTKKCVIKRKLKFEDYKDCLDETQLENKTNHQEKNKNDLYSVKKIIKNS